MGEHPHKQGEGRWDSVFLEGKQGKGITLKMKIKNSQLKKNKTKQNPSLFYPQEPLFLADSQC